MRLPGMVFGAAAMLIAAMTTASAQSLESRLAAAFSTADRNSDGFVDVDEYVAYFAAAFRELDAAGRGYLTIDQVPGADPARFAAADRNGDRRISLGEAIAERMLVFFDIAPDDGVISMADLLAYEARK